MMMPRKKTDHRDDKEKKNDISSSSSSSLSRLEKYTKIFDQLAESETERPPHQISGFTDILEVYEWEQYVQDVLLEASVSQIYFEKKRNEALEIFEVGCGVLAFLQSCLKVHSNLLFGGIDGA